MRFSICMAAYEMSTYGDVFLEENFSHLERQTFKDFEVVLGDHSRDGRILEVCDRWAERLNLTYIKNYRGRGSSAANLNRTMKMVSGDIVVFLFQDDYLINPDALAILDQTIAGREFSWGKLSVACTRDGHEFYSSLVPVFDKRLIEGHNTMSNQSGLVVAREKLVEFDEKLFSLIDCEYFARLYLMYGEPLIVPEICLSIRIHPAAVVLIPRSAEDFGREVSYVREKLSRNFANFWG